MKKSLRVIAVRVIAILLLLSLSFTYFYFAAKKTNAAWFDDGWRYRVAIPISAHTSLETNVYLALTGANGIDTSDTTKFQTDCGDIRFTDSNGNILPHYLTTACGLAQTGFNVFFDSFPAGAQTIYYYYGNAGAPNGFSLQNFPVAATGVTLGSRGTETSAPASPIVFFKFDEGYGQTISNSLSTSYTGTLGPDATSTSTDPSWEGEELCVSGKCIHFVSTSSQYINVSTSVSSVKSIGFWVRPTSTTTSLVVLNGAAGNASLSATSGTLSAGAGFTSPTIYVNGVVSSTISANTWNYITVTTGTGITASNIMLGRVNAGYLNGYMDEVKLYGVALSTSQIKANYAAGMGKIGAIKGSSVSLGSSQASTNALSNGLIGFWKMEESSGNPVDSSGNSVTLTNNGTTPFTAGKFGNGAGTFNGSSRYFSTATSLSIQTVSFWVYPAATTDNFIHFASGKYISATSGTVSATGLTNPTIFVNGVQTSTIVANTWQHITIVDTTAITATAFEVGRANGAYMANGSSIDEVRIYSRALSSIDVRQLAFWTPGPFAYWKFDENSGTSVNDSSGNNYSGSLLGGMGSSSWVQGKVGSGLSFDGIDDHINIYSSGFDTSFNHLRGSISAWIRIPTASLWADTSSNRAIIQLAEDTSNFIVIRKTTTPNQLAFVYTAGGVSVSTLYSTSRTDWFHVALTWDKLADLTNYYVDGTLIDFDTGLGTWSGTGALGATRANIGSRLSDGTDPFQGFIDDVRVYNFPITSGSVSGAMTSGRGVSGSSMGTPIAYWKLDEGYGTSVQDSTSNTNILTLSTTSWTTAGKYASAWNGTGALWMAQSADDSDFDFAASDDFAISMWFKSDSATNPGAAASQFLFGKGTITNTGTVGYTVYADSNGKINFGIRSTSGVWGASSPGTPTPEDVVTSTSDIYDGTWHHILATKTGTSRIDLYVDGKLNASDTSLTATATLANAIVLRVGDDDSDATNSFAGDLDEIKVFRGALTADQVNLLYNNTAAIQLGGKSTSSAGIPDQSAQRAYCPPGNTETNCGSGDPTPIGYWKLDESAWNNNCSTATVFDSSANGNNGTACPASTGPVGNSIGARGRAGNFDGTDDYLDVGDVTYSDSISIEMWIQLHAVDSITWKDIVLKRNSTGVTAGSNEFELAVNKDRNIIWNAWDSGGTGIVNAVGNTALNLNQWYHVAIVHSGSGGNSTIYLNGNIDSITTNSALTLANLNSKLQFGARSASNDSRYFNGLIDDVVFYSYARTPAQIAWDYNRGAPLAWYKFDECQGTTLYNSTLTGTGISAGIHGAFTVTTNTAGICDSSTPSDAWYLGTSGKYNSALGLDGNDYVTLTDTTNYAFSSIYQDFAVFAWVKRAATGVNHFVVSKEDAANDGWNMQITSSNLVSCAVNNKVFTSTSTIDTNWHHIGCVVNRAGNGQVYIDGNPDGTPVAISSTALSLTTTTTTIGARNYTPTGTYFNGLIDNVQIYGYSPSTTQIKLIYNQSSAVRFGPITGQP